jgi:hypothetical protein
LDTSTRALWTERIALLAVLAAFLFVFKTTIPSGDGLAYVRIIDSGVIDWNPNHLLMAPAGFIWHHALALLGVTDSPIVSLKLLSGLSALLSILLFHVILSRLEAASAAWRLAGCLGLFFSTNFLSLAVSEEFFMIQMPLLLAVLAIGLSWGEEPLRGIAAAGILLGLAVLVLSNNVFLLASVCLFLLLRRPHGAFVLGGAAAAVILPGLGLGYWRSGGGDGGFMQWLTSYQGVSGNLTGSLYGIEWTLKGVLESGARLAYNLFANIAEPAGLGTYLKAALFSGTLEFEPHYPSLALGMLLLAVVAAMAVLTVQLAIRTGGLPVRFGSFWLGAYLLFNFLWNDSSDQFWAQLLPVVWIWFMVVPVRGGGKLSRRAPYLLVPLLIVFNTMHVVAPYAFVDVEKLRAEHEAVIKEGDLEIVPGWDRIHWLSKGAGDGSYDQLRLMTLALEGRDGPMGIERLPALVESYLRRGQDVFIARLYDLDGNPRPWDQLRKLGWPRERLQELLQRFDAVEAIEVGGVTIRRLRHKTGPNEERVR